MKSAAGRMDKHEQVDKSSKHLKNIPGNKFDWMISSRAPSHHLKRKIPEAYFIKQLTSSLNDQLETKVL